MIDWDRKENVKKRPMNRMNTHLNDLVNAIRSCGITFSVWEKLDGNGGGSGHHDFTSLMGSDKKRLLSELPTKLEGILKPSVSERVINLWKVCLLKPISLFNFWSVQVLHILHSSQIISYTDI